MLNSLIKFFFAPTKKSNHLAVLKHKEMLLQRVAKERMQQERVERYAEFEWNK